MVWQVDLPGEGMKQDTKTPASTVVLPVAPLSAEERAAQIFAAGAPNMVDPQFFGAKPEWVYCSVPQIAPPGRLAILAQQGWEKDPDGVQCGYSQTALVYRLPRIVADKRAADEKDRLRAKRNGFYQPARPMAPELSRLFGQMKVTKEG